MNGDIKILENKTKRYWYGLESLTNFKCKKKKKNV